MSRVARVKGDGMSEREKRELRERLNQLAYMMGDAPSPADYARIADYARGIVRFIENRIPEARE